MADYVTPMHPPLPVVEEERIYIGSELAHFVSFFNYYHFLKLVLFYFLTLCLVHWRVIPQPFHGQNSALTELQRQER